MAFVIALGACPADSGDSKEKPHVPKPKTITQTNGLGFNGKVTISTSELYLNADWDEVVASVITALNAAYTASPPPIQNQVTIAFGGNGVEIVLVDSLADDKNWEVRDGEFRTLYLKIGSIATADYQTAFIAMGTNSTGVGKASPAKGGVFLAIQRRTPFLERHELRHCVRTGTAV
ncbi:MAG: hypothetical protein LBB89_00130 [Treponema sp.]|nr:hypothetical protein [Treponema sp.]